MYKNGNNLLKKSYFVKLGKGLTKKQSRYIESVKKCWLKILMQQRYKTYEMSYHFKIIALEEHRIQLCYWFAWKKDQIYFTEKATNMKTWH